MRNHDFYDPAVNVKTNPANKKPDLADRDRVLRQIALLDETLETYINKLKSKDAIISYQEMGPRRFNEERYNAEIQQLENRRRSIAQQILSSTHLQDALRLRAEYDSIVAPNRDETRFMDATVNTVQVNVKQAYEQLKQVRDRWDTVINNKKQELKVAARDKLKIYNEKLLCDDECFEAIVAIIKHPCVVIESELRSGRSGDYVTNLKYVRDRNPDAFDACKTITEYHKLVDDGIFDDKNASVPLDDVYKLATKFVNDNNLLDGRSIGCIETFKKRFDDAKRLEELKASL